MGHRKPPEGYITIPEAAKICGLSHQTMYDWVLTRRQFPCKTVIGGTRMFYYLPRDVIEEYARGHQQGKGKSKKRASLYEIVTISLGELTVLYTTSSLVDLSHRYVRMLERENKLIRIRADGKLLTIHESDKLGNTYHPRSKRSSV